MAAFKEAKSVAYESMVLDGYTVDYCETNQGSCLFSILYLFIMLNLFVQVLSRVLKQEVRLLWSLSNIAY